MTPSKSNQNQNKPLLSVVLAVVLPRPHLAKLVSQNRSRWNHRGGGGGSWREALNCIICHTLLTIADWLVPALNQPVYSRPSWALVIIPGNERKQHQQQQRAQARMLLMMRCGDDQQRWCNRLQLAGARQQSILPIWSCGAFVANPRGPLRGAVLEIFEDFFSQN